jgi:Phage integrase central domain
VEASGVTFRRAFQLFFATKRKSLSNAKHAAQWQSTMETYVFPAIGDRPVAKVEAREILDLLAPLWFEKSETARRVLQRMEAVFKSAILRGYRQRVSPCVGVKEELGTRHQKVSHSLPISARAIASPPHGWRSSGSCCCPEIFIGVRTWVAIRSTLSFHTRLADLKKGAAGDRATTAEDAGLQSP